MTRPYIDPAYVPPETSARLVFSANHLDRWSEGRGPDVLSQSLAHSGCQVMGIARGRVALKFDGDIAQCLFDYEELLPLNPHKDRMILLGYEQDEPRLAVSLGVNPDEERFEPPDGFKLIDFRSLAVQGLLNPLNLGLTAQGAALLAWHSGNRFCGRCGQPTEMREGGASRVCTGCQREQYPRTDPVVIMAITKGDKCLLGRSHRFPPGMYSALAGFVESGETMENAVRRETFEEAGIRVGEVTYHATQPWPFPHTLMIGCYGEALEEDIVMDTEELDDARWFHRTELRAILNGEGATNDDGSPQFFTPPKMAIANRLIADWAAKN